MNHIEAVVISQIEVQFLRVLAKKLTKIRASYIGAEIWGKMETQRMPQAYSRPASKVLNRMKAKGLVRYYSSRESWGWRISPKGQDVLAWLGLGPYRSKP